MIYKARSLIWLGISLFAVLIVSCAAPAADVPAAVEQAPWVTQRVIVSGTMK